MRTKFLLWSCGLAAMMFVVLALQGTVRGADPTTSNCPDVVPAISLIPSTPKPGEPIYLRVTVANEGTVDTNTFRTYIYVDPVDQPPNLDTQETTSQGVFLDAGTSRSFEVGPYLLEAGAHVFYAWSDHNDVVRNECNETNNLVELRIDVSACIADSYESPTDNNCAAARLVPSDGSKSRHNLCPKPDQDWIRFDGQAGVTYQVVGDNVEQDAQLLFDLYRSCSDPALAQSARTFGSGATLEIPVLTDGAYYLRVQHQAATYGDATGYDLAVKALCSADGYEPDDRCTLAGEVTAGAPPQTRSFCRTGDEDWVTVWATGGQNYRLATSAWESKSQPQIELYAGCGGELLKSTIGRETLDWTAATTGPVLARIRNADAQGAGMETGYQLQLTVAANPIPETEEPNNSPGEAKSIALQQPQQMHISTPGDQDWLWFEAAANQFYRMETFDLAPNIDTMLCLYDQAATLLACDDDSGQGLGSRLYWQAKSGGAYYLRIYDPAADRGGPASTYQVQLQTATGACDPDGQEPDETPTLAHEVQPNGQLVQHTFCPGGDVDWSRFWITTPGIYDIRVETQGPDADPQITLYDRDGQTVLFDNDDFGPGLSSRILWRFPNAGRYFLRVVSFDGRADGRGAEYSIRIVPSNEEPTPTPLPSLTATPTATPSPTPTPTPTLSWPAPVPTPNGPAQVLLVANRQQMANLYGAEGANLVMNKLAQLVPNPYTPGLILNLDSDVNTMRAYAEWQAQPGSVQAANRVTDAIRQQIGVYLEQHPTIQYVVLVGGDPVIPFRRVQDRSTAWEEKGYLQEMNLPQMNGSALVQALQQNMSLTDDFYVAGKPKKVNGGPLYLPTRVIARLVETPTQIAAYIDRFLADGTAINPYSLRLENLTVAGAYRAKGSARDLCRRLTPAPGIDCDFVYNTWTRPAFLSKFVGGAGPGAQLIAGRGAHWQILTPDNNTIDSSELSAAGNRLNEGVVIASFSHSGLNVSAADPYAVDLPEVYLSLTGIYVGNTGYALYDQKGYHESFTGKLLNFLVEQIRQQPRSDANPTIGKAWLRAKLAYWQQARGPVEADRKVLHSAVLYGLPMYRITQSYATTNTFPSVRTGVRMVASANGDVAPVLDLALEYTNTLTDALQLTTTEDGSYYELDGHTDVSAGLPIQPQYYTPLDALGIVSPTLKPRSILWTGGVYTDVQGFDPVIPELAVDGVTDETTEAAGVAGAETLPGWDQLAPGQVDAGGERLAVTWGQFNAADATERVYGSLTFEFTFSDAADTLAPALILASAQETELSPQVKIETRDDSGVRRVRVVYTDNRGVVHSIDLQHRPDMGKWVGQIPTTVPVNWFAYIEDGAGNVTTVTNKGNFFVAGSGLAAHTPEFVFLPAITR